MLSAMPSESPTSGPVEASTDAGDAWVVETGPVRIDPVKMLRIHGYKNLEKVRPVIRKAADDIAERARGLMVPVAHARRIDVASYDDQSLILADGTQFEDAAFEDVLDGARSVVAVVLTIGKSLDEAVIAAMDKGVFEPLDALFLETAGWLGIEAATKAFVGGKAVNWPLEQQKKLFSLFDAEKLPVTLMESCAMLPKMSRSGIYGLAPVN
jgi:hypothetical protein